MAEDRSREAYNAFKIWFIEKYALAPAWAPAPPIPNFDSNWWEQSDAVEWYGAGMPGYSPTTEVDVDTGQQPQDLTLQEMMDSETLSPEQKYLYIKRIYSTSGLMLWFHTDEGTNFLLSNGVWSANRDSVTITIAGESTTYGASYNTQYALWEFFQIGEEPPEEGLPEAVLASDGTIIALKWMDEDGNPFWTDPSGTATLTQAQVQQRYESYENNLNLYNTDPTKVPTEPNTEGYEWIWDSSSKKWVERRIPDDTELTDPTKVPDIPNTEGYEWAWDGKRWHEKPVTPGQEPQTPMPTEDPAPGYIWDWDPEVGWYQRPGELDITGEVPPMPTEPPPEGYYWDYNPTTGQWEPVPGTIPGGDIDPETGLTPSQQAQLDLQREELKLYAQRLAQEAQIEQDRLKLEYSQYLAGLAANPAAFLEYAVATGQQAAVQPWMPRLDPTGQLQPGQGLPGWGPGQGTAPGGWTGFGGGTPGGGTPQDLPPNWPGGAGVGGDVGWEEIPGGANQTGGLGYSTEREKIIMGRYREILDQLIQARGGTSYLDEWWFALPMEQKNALTQEAERQARLWYSQEYGEDYPIYPGQEQDIVTEPPPDLPPVTPVVPEVLPPIPPAYPEEPEEPGDIGVITGPTRTTSFSGRIARRR